MDAKRDADIDPAPLIGKRVAIIGYGNQGRPQALNLRDSGIDVVIGLRGGSPSAARAEADTRVEALAAEAGSKSAAAQRLGVSRSQFYEKLKRHSLD